MRHLTAAQKGEGGGWHYVNLGRDGGFPVGACRDHEPHATEDEARRCYRAYQREHIRLDAVTVKWTACQAPECDQPTRSAATIQHDGYALAPLCPNHMTIEHATIALGLADDVAGDSWES